MIINSTDPLLQVHFKTLRPSEMHLPNAFRKVLYISSTPNENTILSFGSNLDLIIAKNYHEARYILQCLPPGEKNIPEVIIGDYDKDIREAGRFSDFLANNHNFCAIPFLLMYDEQSNREALKPKPIAGIDDIIKSNIIPEELSLKITLLTKFKSLKLEDRKNAIESGIVYLTVHRKILYETDRFSKRLLDVLISVIALIILCPFLLLIALIIRLESKGPVLYTAYRAGSGYRIFKFIKFRTMVADADHKLIHLKHLNQYGASRNNNPVFFKVSNDPRVTKFGKFLRNTSMDELPQLFNVLKGDMSLVGNRPLPLYEARTLTTDKHAERFIAPAGITGLWQISKRGKKDMSVEERIILDIDYARKNTFWYDLRIIFNTPRALFQKDNV